MHTFRLTARMLLLAALALIGGAVYAEDWKELKAEANREFTSIACPEPRTCYLSTGLYSIGGTGTILKTTDGGDSFTAQKIPTSNPIHSITCPSAPVCFAVGDFGTFLATVDGGTTWTEFTLGSKANPPHLTAVFAVGEQSAIVVGKDGYFVRTIDGGASFSPPAVQTLSDLYGIFFSDATLGFAVGNGGTLLKSTDGGETWVSRGSLMSAGTMLGIHGYGATMYAVGDKLLASIDGGEKWTEQTPALLSRGYRAVAARGDGIAYLISADNEIFKTANSGGAWSSSFKAISILRGIACPAADYCLAVGSHGKVYRLGTPPAAPAPAPAPALEPAPTPAPSPEPAPAAAPEPPVTAQTAALSAAPAQTASPASAQVAGVAAAAVAAAPEKPSDIAPVQQTSLPTLSRTLKRGARGEDVKALQTLLAAVGGVYPEAVVNGTFGPATLRAVGRFQEKYAVAAPGDAGYGQAGPKTRAKLLEIAGFGAQATDVTPAAGKPASISAAPTLSRTLRKGSRGEDVKRLQEILATDAEVYPEGEATGYFGPATVKAVRAFQEKHGLAAPGDIGYGQAGPKTRAKLLELSQ